MRKTLSMLLAVLAFASGAAEFCDFTLNPEARDGHTPADSNRFFTVCASARYEAHPSSVLLPDGRTVIAFWDYWQGGPCGSAAISSDAGRTWTRLDARLPKEFSECYDNPKVWRFVDPKTGKGRLRAFAAYAKAEEFDWRGADNRPLAEAMPSVLSEDDGATWTFRPPLGADFACVIAFSGMARLADGSYLGVYSRGRNPNGDGGDYGIMGSYSRDGGITWEKPFELAQRKGARFYAPTLFRAPDGKELCCLAGDFNSGRAWMCFSRDEGKSWSAPVRAGDSVSGLEQSVGVLTNGDLVVAMRRDKELRGWTGSYGDFRARKDAGAEMRLVHNYGDGSTVGTPNVHVRANGEILVVAYSQFNLHKPMPAIVAMRFGADEVARTIGARKAAKRDFEQWDPFAGTPFRPLGIAKFYGPFAQEVVMRDKKERTIEPFNGKKSYINKVAGSRFREIENKTGCFEIEKYMAHHAGNAAILVWTVRVPEDCKARLRLIGAPSARCCVGERTVLPAVFATIFEPRTAEIALKKGENDIGVMVYQPQGRAASDAGFSEKPMLVAAGLDLKDFKCVRSQKIELKSEDADVSIDDLDMEF